MPDRSEDLRKEAARCLETAARCVNPNSRAELIRLAERFIDLAKSVPSDFGVVVQALEQYDDGSRRAGCPATAANPAEERIGRLSWRPRISNAASCRTPVP
jgi:hypothetical protein